MADTLQQYCHRVGEVLWRSNHFEIGYGYDILAHDPARSPFKKIIAPTAFERKGANILVSRKSFRHESDSESSLETTSSLSASYLSLVSFRACAASLKSAKCNETNMLTLTHFTITIPTEHFKDQLELTDDAISCLANPSSGTKNFESRYGQYAITGQARRATLLLVSRYASKTKEELDRFASEVDLGFDTKKVSVGVANGVLTQRSARDFNIEEHHDAFCVGYDAEHVFQDFNEVNPRTIWNGFLNNYHPMPYLAMLTHYCDLIPSGKISPPPRLLDLALEVAAAIRRCILLQLTARSRRILPARRLDGQMDAIYDSLMAAGPLRCGKPSNMNDLLQRLNVAAREVEICGLRESLLDAVDNAREVDHKSLGQEHKAPDCAYPKWHRWDTDKSFDWPLGITKATVEQHWPELAGDVEEKPHKEWQQVKSTGSLPQCRSGIEKAFLPGRIVIGAKVLSYRNDGCGGWWYRYTEGPGHCRPEHAIGELGTDSFGVKFRTSHCRDGHYQLVTYSVPKDLYQRS